MEWRRLGLTFTPQAMEARPWWMHSHAQAPAALLLDDRIRMYFSCRPAPDANGQYVSFSAFVDLEREDPTQVMAVATEPVLPLGGLGEFDQFGVYPLSPIEMDGEIWAYYGGWTRMVSVPFNVAIGVARSTDGGRRFSRLGTGPILGFTPDEPFVLSGPKVRRFGDMLYLFYIAGKHWLASNDRPEPVYRIRGARSKDGLHWERLGRDLIDVALGPDEAQASPDVFERDGRFHMLFSYRRGLDYRGRNGSYRLGYATSDDLVTWHRQAGGGGLEPALEGWDADMIAYPHVFSVGTQTYLAYLGNGVGRDGFGLAELVAWTPSGGS